MKDRYLFKAKRLDNREWVIGNLIQSSTRSWISSEQADKTRLRSISKTQAIYRAIEVDPSTICQCTGLKDKNSKLIYEGDIVKCLYNDYGEKGVYIGKVIYREDTCCFVDANSESTDYEWWEEEKEVIGNIFDNKELLESEE